MIEGKLSCHMIYQDDDCISILDKYPIDNGHSLVITKKPYEKLMDMDVDEVAKLFSKIPKMLMQLSRQLMLMHLVLRKITAKLQNRLYHMFMYI